jgi:hypothetical protein
MSTTAAGRAKRLFFLYAARYNAHHGAQHYAVVAADHSLCSNTEGANCDEVDRSHHCTVVDPDCSTVTLSVLLCVQA